tara:strand:+ start:188 stop:1240 length:1053 start_codon:yes stop_codon:yes gene_type:complete
MILTPFDTPCIMIENLSDISAQDLFKYKCINIKDKYSKKYADFYNTERYTRYGVCGILPVGYSYEYHNIINDWQRKIHTVGVDDDVVIVILKHVQMFQNIYKRMEGLPISINGNRENEEKVFDALIDSGIVKKVLSSVKEEQDFLENHGMSVSSELKTYSYYCDVQSNWENKSGVNRWRTKKGVNNLEKLSELTYRILDKKDSAVEKVIKSFSQYKEEVHNDRFLSKKFSKSIIEYPYWNDDKVDYYLFEYAGIPIGLVGYVYTDFGVAYQIINKGIHSMIFTDEELKSIPIDVQKRLGAYMHCKSIEILKEKKMKYSFCGGVFDTMRKTIAIYKKLMNDDYFGMKVYSK